MYQCRHRSCQLNKQTEEPRSHRARHRPHILHVSSYENRRQRAASFRRHFQIISQPTPQIEKEMMMRDWRGNWPISGENSCFPTANNFANSQLIERARICEKEIKNTSQRPQHNENSRRRAVIEMEGGEEETRHRPQEGLAGKTRRRRPIH